jgi:uncharacterized protein YydD (DUF2326 family)
MLRQDNSMISSKSDELSLDDIDLPTSQQPEINEHDSLSEEAGGCFEKQVQGWLERLICFGLF